MIFVLTQTFLLFLAAYSGINYPRVKIQIMSKMRIVKMITNCSLESVLPQQSKLLIRILETHFMMLWYRKKLVLTENVSISLG